MPLQVLLGLSQAKNCVMSHDKVSIDTECLETTHSSTCSEWTFSTDNLKALLWDTPSSLSVFYTFQNPTKFQGQSCGTPDTVMKCHLTAILINSRPSSRVCLSLIVSLGLSREVQPQFWSSQDRVMATFTQVTLTPVPSHSPNTVDVC